MEDIAINTGISRQALYKYFPSRIDLLVYLLKSIDKDHTLLEKLMVDQSLSIKEKLNELELFFIFFAIFFSGHLTSFV